MPHCALCFQSNYPVDSLSGFVSLAVTTKRGIVMSKQENFEKNPTFDTAPTIEFCTLLTLVSRLSGALDSAITGKDRSVLVNELSQLTVENLPEQEKSVTSEALKRALETLKRD
ncbi:hypothetical protein D5F51_06345 [Yersinia hibernica]|uniref:DUF1844 domain-containing protein n=2 Tax=Yersinia hibernica TaxID=2339259 RepID=A0ABX5QY12_9GAMM|nr:hypothetical protein D5F51_06345 [Yersinia hibernica]